MYDDLPYFLTIGEVAKLLRISRTAAYNLAKTPGFPLTQLPDNNRKIVSKDALLDWLGKQQLPLDT